ncbi:MAG TPA: hypothetical protein VK735_14760 [Pseudonocardia sp.]|nr:hypothetical protein [Pseudonocardia sp.]
MTHDGERAMSETVDRGAFTRDGWCAAATLANHRRPASRDAAGG